MAFELDPPSEEMQQHLQELPYPPAAAGFVRFYERQKRNVEESAKQGRPVYEPVEYVEIHTAGDKDNVVDRPVREIDKRLWEAKYVAFKSGQSQETGTPLDVWGGITPARVEELRYFKITTVEQLAATPDGNLSRLGPLARTEREKAQRYLEALKADAPIAELKAENDALKARLDALERLAAANVAPAEEVKPAKKGKQVAE